MCGHQSLEFFINWQTSLESDVRAATRTASFAKVSNLPFVLEMFGHKDSGVEIMVLIHRAEKN